MIQSMEHLGILEIFQVISLQYECINKYIVKIKIIREKI